MQILPKEEWGKEGARGKGNRFKALEEDNENEDLAAYTLKEAQGARHFCSRAMREVLAPPKAFAECSIKRMKARRTDAAVKDMDMGSNAILPLASKAHRT